MYTLFPGQLNYTEQLTYAIATESSARRSFALQITNEVLRGALLGGVADNTKVAVAGLGSSLLILL